MSYMLHVVAICILGQKLSAEAAENEVAEMLDQTFSMRRDWIHNKKPEMIEILNKWSQLTRYPGQVKMSGTMEHEVQFLCNKESLMVGCK